jgi:hypothetical protein
MLRKEIDDLDTKLDSLTDSKSAGRSALIKTLVEQFESAWSSVVESFSTQLASANAEQRIGVYYGIVRGLENSLGATVRQELDAKVETLPAPTPLITAEEAPALGKIRSELYQKIKNTIDLAKGFDGGDSGMEMPKRRTGARGKRGKRALSYFTWSIEDKEFATLKDVVELYSQYDKVAELTKAMRDAQIDTSKPGEKIEFALPDGKTLIGIRSADAPKDEEIVSESSGVDGDDDTDEDDED